MWPKTNSNKNIHIHLLEPIVYVSSNLDSLPVIRGIIEVNVPYEIKNLYLFFKGTMKTHYIQDSKSKSNIKMIAQNMLELHNAVNKTKRYPFEMPLPAGIPETIQSNQVNVTYELSVKLDYYCNSTIVHEEHTQPIILARLPENGMLAGENHTTTTLDSRKHYSNWCQYRISLDKQAITIGSTLPVKIEIAPIVNELRLKQIIVQLVEKSTIVPENNRSLELKSQSAQYIYPARGHALILPAKPLTSQWEASCVYQIPNEKKISHSTENYTLFNIAHTLLVSIVISVPAANKYNNYGQGRLQTKTISFQTDIDLLDSHLSNLSCELPPYNCPVSTEELYKLNSHGLASLPPTYEDALCLPSTTRLYC